MSDESRTLPAGLHAAALVTATPGATARRALGSRVALVNTVVSVDRAARQVAVGPTVTVRVVDDRVVIVGRQATRVATVGTGAQEMGAAAAGLAAATSVAVPEEVTDSATIVGRAATIGPRRRAAAQTLVRVSPSTPMLPVIRRCPTMSPPRSSTLRRVAIYVHSTSRRPIASLAIW